MVCLLAVACGEDPVQSNQAPVVAAAIPAATVSVEDTLTIDLSAYFNDPDGDHLTFAATTSDAGVAGANAAGTSLAVYGMTRGTADITVAATDPDGLSVSQSFAVTVPNRPPEVAASIPDLDLATGDTILIHLPPHFSDPDGDALGFEAESSDAATVATSVSDVTLTISAVAPGAATLAVTATDPSGGSASLGFGLTAPNRAPVVTDSVAEFRSAPGGSRDIDLATLFADPDAQALTFAAEGSDAGAVSTSLAGSILTVTAVAAGRDTIALTAVDPGGLSVTRGLPVAVSANSQRDILAALHEAADGANWRNSLNWLTEEPLASWYGVTLDEDGRVARLELSDNGLVGPVPWELGWLTGLEVLDLEDNELTGTIPAELFSLPRLKTLNVDSNSLWGPIPLELTALRTLEVLDLDGNDFSGPIPPELARLDNLRVLDLDLNNLTGPIPAELGSLPNLTNLSASFNSLSGSIPPELGNLAGLTYLGLHGNDLTGPVPAIVGRLVNLRSLRLRNNALTGPVPPIGDLVALTRLELQGNDLSGPVPPGLARLTSLTELRLDNNRFTGSIPPELGVLANLQILGLAGNDLTGSIPPELSHLSDLRSLHLERNELSGPIPPELGALTRLRNFHLHENDLSGSIPPELCDLVAARQLYLHGNALTGSIPPELDGLLDVRRVYLHNNLLTGPVPPELAELSRLERLYLHNNMLTGAVPRGLMDIRLRDLSLQNNNGLCVPGVADFVAWTQDIGVDEEAFCNRADRDALTALFEATGGADWSNNDGWLTDAALERWHGVASDSLGRVTELDLAGNGLAGRLPSALGLLHRMTGLRIGANDLTGTLPLALESLPLQTLHYAGTDLCTSADRAFRDWLGTIPSHLGTDLECDPLTDHAILVALHGATAGEDWLESENWLTGAPLGSWHGVEVDEQGRIIALELGDNNLTGAIPPELGELDALETLDLGGNDLTGIIPGELGRLAGLRSLRLSGNALTGGIPGSVFALANLEQLLLDRNRLTGRLPSEVANLAGLVHLRLDGNDFTGVVPPLLGSLVGLAELRLDGNRLSGPIPPELGALPVLTVLRLGGNNLSGGIPPELVSLAVLEELSLSGNRLSGPVPLDLAALTSLAALDLSDNSLTGRIPAELAGLAELTRLDLSENDLGGGIPAELGALATLAELHLSANQLNGRVPAALGRLTSLEVLRLDDNQLEGPVPAALGNMTRLTELQLQDNDFGGSIPAELGSLEALEDLRLNRTSLTGPIPSELGGLTGLRKLHLQQNHGLTGPLPPAMTWLRQLDEFQAWDTDLCAPDEAEVREWLQGIRARRVANCASAAAYLTQAVQLREHPVPLVAGEEALLRVFVVAGRYTTESLPPVRASFFVDGTETYVVDIAGGQSAIPTGVDESSLAKSVNATIPGSVVRPGLEMVIEVDPDSTLHPSLGVQRRIPETGRLSQDVREMPVLDLTLIPMLWTSAPDSAIVDTIGALAEAAHDHELLWAVRTLLPVAEIEAAIHPPVLTSTNDPSSILEETVAIQAMEGGEGYYMGMMSGPVRTRWGAGLVGGNAAFSHPDPRVLAHVLGHNLGILHAPCGQVFGIHPQMERDGSLGAWGYDFRDGGSLVDPSIKDLMSQCSPWWAGEFSFSTMLQNRLELEEVDGARASVSSPERSLLLWGGTDADGNPSLEPALVVDAAPRLPTGTGDYVLRGLNAHDEVLFSLSFDMEWNSEGGGAFAFVLPVRHGWEKLAGITLSGPSGTAASLNEDGAPGLAVLLDSRTGRVRGIWRNLPGSVRTRVDAEAMLPAGSGVEVLFSRGIPAVPAPPHR